MKKPRILILAMALVFMVTGGVLYAAYGSSQTADIVRADNTEVIVGLQEKMDALFLTRVADQAMLDNMYQQRVDRFNETFPLWLENTKRVSKTGGKTDEQLREEQWNAVKPDFERYFLVTCLNTIKESSYQATNSTLVKYIKQYAESGYFSYLFSNMRYWSKINDWNFSEDGMLFVDAKDVFGISVPRLLIGNEANDFLWDIEGIEELLLTKGETVVSDVKLFTILEGIGFLYIKCEENEYMIRVQGSSDFIPELEMLKIYLASDAIDIFTSFITKRAGESQYTKEVADSITSVKPLYFAEGEFLMADGIIQGNERGFDPLKPLSRIEATTIIVRALGYENEATSGSSQFADIPDGSWGVKYANIAADKGISVGVGDGKFAPDELVTDNQFATFVLRAADEKDFDWQQAIDMLIERGIISTENAGTMDLFTRGDMAKIIYEAREKGLLISEN